MPSYRYPILIWHHPDGGCTACLVEDHRNLAALAASAREAVAQLKDLLQWRLKKEGTLSEPDFVEPKLNWMKADVRPEYHSIERVFSMRQIITLRVPAVLGKDRSGLHVCAMPTLGVRFSFDESEDLPGLSAHYIQTALKGQTPQQLARQLPPAVAELADVSIHIPKPRGLRELAPDLAHLHEVAEPIGGRGNRTRLSRPWQRDAEVARLELILRKEKASVLLLGESGSGKSAVLAEAVRKAERAGIETAGEPDNDAPRNRTRFWLTSGGRLIAGMKYLGQWQERIEEVISRLDDIEGVLCVDNLLDLLRTGGESASDSLAAFLVPYLQRGELRLVGEATAAELDACRRLLPAFAAVFTIVEVPQFNASQAVAALEQLATVARQNLKVTFTTDAIRQIYRLFARFMPYQCLPGRAAAFTTDLFDRVARSNESVVTSEKVVERFIKLTGLPELFLRDDRTLQSEQVVDHFSARVMGQSPACRAVASVITTFKAGLNDPQRPLGVLLFCGPTGVGKTELARTISEFLFGQGDKRDRMVRLDMSEYAGPGAAARLLGAAGAEPSELIKRLREQPFTVLLLDEIEKAAAEVFDVLLGVFDEGRLTDRFGRLTTFNSAIIIMTSNLGADRMQPFGLSKSPASNYTAEAMNFFRPEFFNRIDAVVNFSPLSTETIRQITVAELSNLAKRDGLTANNITLEWTDDVVGKLCQAGYDARYGARPLQRAIEMLIVTPLAKFLIQRPGLEKRCVNIAVRSDGNIEFSLKD